VPVNNILRSGNLADPDDDRIGLNEVIVEGERKTAYFYEKQQ
jgi:hypothetical protein